MCNEILQCEDPGKYVQCLGASYLYILSSDAQKINLSHDRLEKQIIYSPYSPYIGLQVSASLGTSL